MPVPTLAYSCRFKCGCRVVTKRKGMEAHEGRCFHNPIRKACQSCANFQTEPETIYVPHFDREVGDLDIETTVRYCAAGIDIEKTLHCDCQKWTDHP